MVTQKRSKHAWPPIRFKTPLQKRRHRRRPRDWTALANCSVVGPDKTTEIFYPAGCAPEMGPVHIWREARTYCVDCPVKTECLDEAIGEEGPMANGFRGGKTPKEREQIYRERLANGEATKPTRREYGYRNMGAAHIIKD